MSLKILDIVYKKVSCASQWVRGIDKNACKNVRRNVFYRKRDFFEYETVLFNIFV